VYNFCELLSKEYLNIKWGCQGARIDSLEKIDFRKLEESGCKYLYVGIESGSEKVLKYIKKQISLEQIKNVIKKFADSNIIAHYNFMVGYPIEGIRELYETIDLVDQIMKTDPKAQFSSFHLITPYPGTIFYEMIKKNGIVLPSTLEEWANIRWETDNASWISSKMKKICFNLSLLTYFIDEKVLYRVKYRSLLLQIVTRFLMKLAKLHWKYRQFYFCPEFNILNKLVNIKIFFRNNFKQG
jgi:radical SAM superfamily enzyme YgiQ (UPF0313 family)